MKRTFIVEETTKTKHKITVEVADDIGIAEEVYDGDELTFDEVIETIKYSDNLEDCEGDIYRIDGVECVEIEYGVWDTESLKYIEEE